MRKRTFRHKGCGVRKRQRNLTVVYERSQKIGAPLFQQIQEVNPDYVSTDCETCKWQIEMSTGYPVMNPISILAEALDVEATKALNQNC